MEKLSNTKLAARKKNLSKETIHAVLLEIPHSMLTFFWGIHEGILRSEKNSKLRKEVAARNAINLQRVMDCKQLDKISFVQHLEKRTFEKLEKEIAGKVEKLAKNLITNKPPK